MKENSITQYMKMWLQSDYLWKTSGREELIMRSVVQDRILPWLVYSHLAPEGVKEMYNAPELYIKITEVANKSNFTAALQRVGVGPVQDKNVHTIEFKYITMFGDVLPKENVSVINMMVMGISKKDVIIPKVIIGRTELKEVSESSTDFMDMKTITKIMMQLPKLFKLFPEITDRIKSNQPEEVLV